MPHLFSLLQLVLQYTFTYATMYTEHGTPGLHVHVQVEKDHTTTPHPPTGYQLYGSRAYYITYNNAELADTYIHTCTCAQYVTSNMS